MKVEFENGFAKDFKMAVGSFFKEALQKERFNAGDIIYDSPKAYVPLWADALPHINYAFKVVQTLGADIEYDFLCRNEDGASLIVKKRIKEPVSDFLRHLKYGLSVAE